MLKNKLSVFLLVSSVVLFFAGCGANESVVTKKPQAAVNTEPPKDEAVPVAAKEIGTIPSPNLLQDALDLGTQAAQLAKFAQDNADWKTVNVTWLAAVEKLESIPADNEDYRVAQQKKSEYQFNANVALKKAESLTIPQMTPQPTVTPKVQQQVATPTAPKPTVTPNTQNLSSEQSDDVVTPTTNYSEIRMEQYNQISTGMNYEDVTRILGEGQEMSRSELAGYITVMYMWQNTNGSNMNVMLQNNAVVQKAQFGLK